MNPVIANAVTIFREFPNASDVEVLRRLVATGCERVMAARLLVGVACSVFAGYVAAWLAKRDELLNGTLSSFLCEAIGIYSIAFGKGSHAHWVQILILISAPICGFLGGYLRVRQRSVRAVTV